MSTIDIAALRASAMDPKAQQQKPSGTGPKPVPRSWSFPLETENPDGTVDRFVLHSTIHRDLDGMIDRAALQLAGAPLGHFLSSQVERFLMLARCLVQLDNFSLERKLETAESRSRLEELLFDQPAVLDGVARRLAEHHRRFRYGNRPEDGGAAGEGQTSPKKPVVVVGEFDAADGNSGARR